MPTGPSGPTGPSAPVTPGSALRLSLDISPTIEQVGYTFNQLFPNTTIDNEQILPVTGFLSTVVSSGGNLTNYLPILYNFVDFQEAPGTSGPLSGSGISLGIDYTYDSTNGQLTFNKSMRIEVTYGTTIRIGAADKVEHNVYVRLDYADNASVTGTPNNFVVQPHSYVSTTLNRNQQIGNGDGSNSCPKSTYWFIY